LLGFTCRLVEHKAKPFLLTKTVFTHQAGRQSHLVERLPEREAPAAYPERRPPSELPAAVRRQGAKNGIFF
jgi:hypothetical protein